MSEATDHKKQAPATVHVPEGADRLRESRATFGMPILFKTAPSDTNGELFIIENITPHKGGPPRHLHYEQEEWFYVVEGEYIIEVGEQEYRLKSGDSLLAPRQVPHVWANIGEATGKLLIVFQPAGQMEAFFQAMAQLQGPPSREELAPLFQAHGMELTGLPLNVS
jgi:quercetin dioxygenase-like cupin family protein